MDRMPTIFLSHGSPMHAIEPGKAAPAWHALAQRLPRPRAILVASAHWETDRPMLTSSSAPKTVYDIYEEIMGGALSMDAYAFELH
jgi:4,5-DOPA dioxygenase extradiol